MDENKWKIFRLSLEWSVAAACIITLLAGTGTLLSSNVTAVAAMGGIAATFAIFEHGWYRAPHAVGTPIRIATLMLAVWVPMAAFGWWAWPRTGKVPPEPPRQRARNPGHLEGTVETLCAQDENGHSVVSVGALLSNSGDTKVTTNQWALTVNIGDHLIRSDAYVPSPIIGPCTQHPLVHSVTFEPTSPSQFVPINFGTAVPYSTLKRWMRCDSKEPGLIEVYLRDSETGDVSKISGDYRQISGEDCEVLQQSSSPRLNIGLILGADKRIGIDAIADCKNPAYQCLTEAEATAHTLPLDVGAKGWARLILQINNIGGVKLENPTFHIESPQPVSMDRPNLPDPARMPRNVLDATSGPPLEPFSIAKGGYDFPIDVTVPLPLSEVTIRIKVFGDNMAAHEVRYRFRVLRNAAPSQ